MRVESVNIAGASPMSLLKAADRVDSARKERDDVDIAAKQQVQPEELLGQIKALTEEGLYSVRFENAENSNDLVVKIVDRETDEVIRQVPAQEVLKLRATLDDLIGNIVNTQG